MKNIQSRKEYFQHLAKLANCANEVERINEQVQYFASIGVGDYYHLYNVKKFGKSIKKAKEMFQTNGFTIEEDKSGVKGKSILHISWADSTEGIAHTFSLVYKRNAKLNRTIKKIYEEVEKAASNGSYSLELDLTDAGIETDVVMEKLNKTGDFNKVSFVDSILVIEWRN